MPYLAHRRVHAVPRSSSPSPSPSPSLTTPLPAVHEPASQKKHVINREAWPPFPPPQSLSDDSTQLYLALKSQNPTPSPSLSPLSSRQPSTSGRATPPDPDSSVPTSVTEGSSSSSSSSSSSIDPGDDNMPAPPESLASDKDWSKVEDDGPLSAASVASNQSANHEDGQERTEAEEFSRRARERELRGLSTAAQRRAYFRDATRRRELIFGPEVRVHTPPNSFPLPPKICGVG